ncbi:MAG: 5-carboxymethyl-2-hydroxymuconate isomerase [Mesorhizobium sp.]|nr:5-carboxymethyl-2-hydroxymuconate isomerase [Mesorhizobium sp.]
MPHCVIEHYEAFPSNGERERAMQLALSVCSASGIMAPEDVKVRCVEADAILFGDGRGSFVHITLSLLAGRTEAQKIGIAEALRDAFRRNFPGIASISIDTRDMDPGCYRKSLV